MNLLFPSKSDIILSSYDKKVRELEQKIRQAEEDNDPIKAAKYSFQLIMFKKENEKCGKV